jgi:hypothetical protein
MLTSLIATPQAARFPFFFVFVEIEVFSSCNSSFTSDLYYLSFTGGGKIKIAKGNGFLLYKIDNLVIVISSALSNKSIGTNSRN